jgi:hypothetical protein
LVENLLENGHLQDQERDEMVIKNVVEESGSSLYSAAMFGLRGVKFSM